MKQHHPTNNIQLRKKRIKAVMMKTAQDFGRAYGFTKAEIEEIFQESYQELVVATG